MAYMIWNYNGLLIIYFFANRSFNLMVFFLNQIQLTLEFLQGPLLFLIFFNDVHSPLRHCTIITYNDDTVLFYILKRYRCDTKQPFPEPR